MIMDSLKVSGLSAANAGVVLLDIIPWLLMCIMLCMNITYLYWKIIKVKES